MPETDDAPRRRVILVLGCGFLLAGGLVAGRIWFWKDSDKLPVPQAAVPAEVEGGRLNVTHDGVELFQRAFWKRPSAGDKIRHAERREWTSEKDGVRQWQWFLAVQPGAGLMDDLKSRFRLEPGLLVAEKFSTAPEWFRAALTKSSTVLSVADDSMILVQSAGEPLLLATGSGGGFALPPASR